MNMAGYDENIGVRDDWLGEIPTTSAVVTILTTASPGGRENHQCNLFSQYPDLEFSHVIV